MRRVTVFALALCLGLATKLTAQVADACPSGRVPLLILGTFHMAGSTQDAVALQFDDMGSPRRQAELLDLTNRLARFRPTKIAIESSRISTVWNDRYKAWLEGSYELGFNEIEQVGFRLAKRLNLTALSPVDYPMWMNGLTAIERHQPRREETPPAAVSSPAPAQLGPVETQLAQDEARLRASSVGDYLRYLNSPERSVMNHRWDVISNLAPGASVAIYQKTDLATNWYKRNLRIYTNIIAVTEPGDRVLLIIGNGHSYLLNSLASVDPRYCVVRVDAYLQSDPTTP